jgi:hypothetical protein
MIRVRGLAAETKKPQRSKHTDETALPATGPGSVPTIQPT